MSSNRPVQPPSKRPSAMRFGWRRRNAVLPWPGWPADRARNRSGPCHDARGAGPVRTAHRHAVCQPVSELPWNRQTAPGLVNARAAAHHTAPSLCSAKRPGQSAHRSYCRSRRRRVHHPNGMISARYREFGAGRTGPAARSAVRPAWMPHVWVTVSPGCRTSSSSPVTKAFDGRSWAQRPPPCGGRGGAGRRGTRAAGGRAGRVTGQPGCRVWQGMPRRGRRRRGPGR